MRALAIKGDRLKYNALLSQEWTTELRSEYSFDLKGDVAPVEAARLRQQTKQRLLGVELKCPRLLH